MILQPELGLQVRHDEEGLQKNKFIRFSVQG